MICLSNIQQQIYEWHWGLEEPSDIYNNVICNALGREKSIALPLFHSFTGCHTTSTFLGKGMKSVSEAWKSFPEVKNAFLHMASNLHTSPTNKSKLCKLLGHYCVVVYDKTSNLESVNEAQREHFCEKNTTMETIPPTKHALLHTVDNLSTRLALVHKQ